MPAATPPPPLGAACSAKLTVRARFLPFRCVLELTVDIIIGGVCPKAVPLLDVIAVSRWYGKNAYTAESA